jgi:hypothetical protein
MTEGIKIWVQDKLQNVRDLVEDTRICNVKIHFSLLNFKYLCNVSFTE